MKTCKWPAPLTSGATIGIVTLGAPEAARNPDHVQRGLDWLQSRGFRYKIGPHALSDSGFLAGTPTELVGDFARFLLDPEVSLIMVAGGGANCNRMLRFIDVDLFASAGKGVLGLSNPTLLLNALTAKSGLISFHGPALVWNFGGEDPLDEYSERHLWTVLKQESTMVVEPEDNWRWLRSGQGDGIVLGGNLWSLQQLLGTQWEPDWSNTVLCIEDCFSQVHQLDAILTHFDDAGVLKQLAGMVVGVFEGLFEEDYPPAPPIEDVIWDLVKSYNYPVLSGVHIGHTNRKITIPLGAKTHLDSTINLFSFDPPVSE